MIVFTCICVCFQRAAADTQYRVVWQAEDLSGAALGLHSRRPEGSRRDRQRSVRLRQQDGAQTQWTNHGRQSKTHVISYFRLSLKVKNCECVINVAHSLLQKGPRISIDQKTRKVEFDTRLEMKVVCAPPSKIRAK